MAPPPAWELIVPPGGQQLLTVGLSNKLGDRQREMCLHKAEIKFSNYFLQNPVYSFDKI